MCRSPFEKKAVELIVEKLREAEETRGLDSARSLADDSLRRAAMTPLEFINTVSLCHESFCFFQNRTKSISNSAKHIVQQQSKTYCAAYVRF